MKVVNVILDTYILFLPLFSSLFPSLLTTLNHAELTGPVCTELHDAGVFWSSWERAVVFTTSRVANSLAGDLPRTHPGTERAAAGRDQCHQGQIPEPKWSMAGLPPPP